MNDKTLVILALGAVAGYVIYDKTREAKRLEAAKKAIGEAASRAEKAVGEAASKVEEATEDLRVPRPDFRVHLPDSESDFAALAELICDCAKEADAQGELPFDEFVRTTRDCVMQALYPGFEWPPVPGDHPTVQHLWLIVTYEVQKGAINGTICTEES